MEYDRSREIPLFLDRLLKQFLPFDRVASYKSYFYNLISIRISSPKLIENSIKESIIKSLKDPSKVSQFQSLFLRLIRLKAITKRAEILYVLSKLQNNSPSIIQFEPISHSPPKENLKKIIIFPSKNEEKQRIMQEGIVEDLFRVLEHEPGRYLKFQEASDCFDLEQAETLPPIKAMAQRISEFAFLIEKIIKFVSKEHVSITCSKLAEVLKDEIISYNDLLLEMKNKANNKEIKVYLWTYEPIRKIIVLAGIVDAIDGLKGSQIISVVFLLRNQGNLAIREMLDKLLAKTSEGLISMIQSWVNLGEIDDPYEEFFITEDKSIGENELWTSRYSVIHDLVPCFFTADLVQKMLIIGKSINFIKICCQEPWIPLKTNFCPSFSDMPNLTDWVNNMVERTNAELLRLVNFKYSLEMHFLSLKKYLLLAQGDFHQLLMSKLIDLLGENANSLFKHNLVTQLDICIRKSNARFEEIECLNRLDAKLLEASPMDTGWDVFLLDYIFSPPLTTIFTTDAMRIYLRTFKFLWQIKRAHFLMNDYSFNRDMIVYQTYFELKMVFHAFQLAKYEIVHFINNLMSYLIVEVVEASWNVFSAKLAKASGLDDLIAVHQHFLAVLTEKAFLDDEGMYKRIMALVELCVRYYEMQQALLKAAAEERKRREVYIMTGTVEELSVFDEMLCDVNLIREQFNDEFRDFRMKVSGAKVEHLKFLAFRLDFNEYYEVKSLEYVE
jgi:gamma-tubulin complex component 3